MTDDPSQTSEKEERDPSLAADVIRSSALPVAGGVVGAAIGASIAGFPGVALGNAVGALIPEATKNVLEHYQRRVGKSAEQVVEWTAELAGKSLTDLYTWAVHDDERLALLSATIQAALSTLDREKIRTLAHVLAEAVEDDAKLDLAHVMAKSLAALNPPHVRVLKAMCTEKAPPGDTDEYIPSGVWLHSAFQVRFANLGDGILSTMATLEQHALVSSRGLAATRRDGRADVAWSVTEYGRQVFEYLARSATELSPEA